MEKKLVKNPSVPFGKGAIQGVAGDAYGGLWWIERPQAALDQWQLWHYDPTNQQIVRRLQASSALFPSTGENGAALTPELVAIAPAPVVDPAAPATVDLILDTFDGVNQTPNTGLYRLALGPIDLTGQATLPAAPALLLAAGQYQGPLVVSPDLTRLAYLAYDPDRRSQTAGARQLANSVRLLDMAAANADALLYQAETPIEYLAPALDWLGSNRLLVQRARLAGESDSAANPVADVFGVAELQLTPTGQPGAAVAATGAQGRATPRGTTPRSPMRGPSSTSSPMPTSPRTTSSAASRSWPSRAAANGGSVSYTHLRAHETVLDLVCRLLLEKKKKNNFF